VTYCAGWKHKGSVCLWADTVAATPIAPRRQQVSLGELLTEPRAEPIEEPSLALHRIGSGTVVACAGDVASAMPILAFLQAHHERAASNSDLLWLLERHLDAVVPPDPVELLLASSRSDGTAELLRWSTAGGLDADAADFLQIGVAPPYRGALTPELLSVLAGGDLAPELLLPVVGALVQSHRVRGASTDRPADGLIFGVRSAAGSISWQDDTLVVFYDPSFASSTHLAALARDDELVVHSSDNDVTRVFASPASAPQRPPRDTTWLRGIRAALTTDSFRYRVFISIAEAVVTLIIRHDFERESRYVRLTARGNGQFDLALSPELTSLLLRPLVDRGQGALPLQLSVRED
jgi:hypothetical protein